MSYLFPSFRQTLRRLLVGAASLGLVAQAASGEETKKKPPLNILLFTADDLDCQSVGVFGGQPGNLTPNIDRFAAEGMIFERAHVVAAICMPSRIALATGLYGHSSGAMGFQNAKPGTPNVVSIFKEAGYLTGILGKVGHSTAVPTDKWDFSFDKPALGGGRNPDLYKKRCADFFAQCKAEGKPFYFMVNSHDPHRPYHKVGEPVKGAAEPSQTYTSNEVTVPGFLPDLPGVRDEMSTYLNSVRRCDDTFGRTMEALAEAGYADNTLVLFLSDNGIAMPFAKANCYLVSTRTPLIVRWPGHIKPDSVDTEHFVSGVDYLPTILQAAGIPDPARLDGHSFLPLLLGESQKDRDVVFTQIDALISGPPMPMRCVQNARYGYIFNPWSGGNARYRNNNEGETMKAMELAAETDPAVAERVKMFRHRVPEEFYDLANDPNCLNNLINDPSVAEERDALIAQLRQWMVKTEDPALAAFDVRDDQKARKNAMSTAFARPKEDSDKGKDGKGKKNAKDED